MKLAERTQGRDNNLNLIRIIAAYAVLVSHSYVLATGMGGLEPFTDSLGMTLGSMAVDVFFLASGLLVTGSLMAHKNLKDFFWARILRIFPGLWMMLVLTVFVLGPALSMEDFRNYFSSHETYQFFIKSATILTGAGKSLPGVFESNPFSMTVNGSLWTLKYELRMYAILALTWFFSGFMSRKFGHDFFSITVLSVTLISGVMYASACLGYARYSHQPHLFFMFFVGASFYLMRHRIELSVAVVASFLALLSVSGLWLETFKLAYALSLPYILFFVAYVPGGWIRRYNARGDYSYGVYIYAFPVQQAIMALWPDIGVAGLLLGSTVLVLPLAVLSWHLVEKPSMKLRHRWA
jgi:peptidoglycan/LPS O-acetylase OafA/YrhL